MTWPPSSRPTTASCCADDGRHRAAQPVLRRPPADPDPPRQGPRQPVPALEWSGVPEEAVELAVLCEDPDAPRGTFIHWVLAGLEPTAPGLVEGERPAAAVAGRNDFGEEGYSGPQPPVGGPPHRYFFRVFAASAPLELTAGASAEDLRRALKGRELASGTLVGTYQR